MASNHSGCTVVNGVTQKCFIITTAFIVILHSSLSMFFNLFKNKKPSVSFNQSDFLPRDTSDNEPPLYYNWVITHKLAIGPIPRTSFHWKQLENDGFQNRFSCCYPNEHIFVTIPDTWNSREVSLPDHRAQNPLERETLISALLQAREMIRNNSTPLYLHCFAGQERSALMAIGLVCLLENKDLFDSIAFVRQCHKRAKPLYSHLDLLEQVLREMRQETTS